MARVVKSFSYDTVDDRDLSIKIEALPHGALSEVIRAALRAFWATEATTATIDDVYQVVRRIERTLASGAVVLGTAADGDQQDADQVGDDVAGTEDAAANLAAWV